jgi:ribosomal protein S18 acetylase RimI-like enzyme
MHVCEAVPSDYDAIGELTARVYLDEGFTLANAEARLRNAAARDRAGWLLVAEDEGRIVGAVSLVPVGSELSQIAVEGEMEMRLLAVSRERRGRGVGEALVRAAVELAGGHRVVLSTLPAMEAAQRLYERLGFVRSPGRDWVDIHGRTMLTYCLEPGTPPAR